MLSFAKPWANFHSKDPKFFTKIKLYPKITYVCSSIIYMYQVINIQCRSEAYGEKSTEDFSNDYSASTRSFLG